MTIVLNHTIVPVKDKQAAARFFADTFGLSYDPADDHAHFAPVRVNDTLTLLFDNADVVRHQHYAFHVVPRGVRQAPRTGRRHTESFLQSLLRQASGARSNRRPASPHRTKYASFTAS